VVNAADIDRRPVARQTGVKSKIFKAEIETK